MDVDPSPCRTLPALFWLDRFFCSFQLNNHTPRAAPDQLLLLGLRYRHLFQLYRLSASHEAMVPPTDVDMAPDDSFTSPLAADLAMEEDTLDLDAPVEYDTFDAEEEGSMAVSEDEQDELIMEDPEEVSAEVEEDVVGEGETDMLLEPSDTVDHATSAVEDGVSLEVKGVVEPEAEAKAIVDVDISGLPSPAPVVAPSPQPDLDDQPDDPADATDLSSATDNILQVEVAVSPKPESFVLVESPSDAEDNGEPAVAEEADEDGPSHPLTSRV